MEHVLWHLGLVSIHTVIFIEGDPSSLLVDTVFFCGSAFRAELLWCGIGLFQTGLTAINVHRSLKNHTYNIDRCGHIGVVEESVYLMEVSVYSSKVCI